jgi:microcystin-dependent protein
MAFETIAEGLTIQIPTQGTRNWATTIRNECFRPISSHDHTGDGDGVQIGTDALATEAVTTAKIDDEAVTTAKIDDEAVTLAKLAAAVQAFLLPTGAILPYGGAAAPTGFLLCDGTAVSRTTYATLFAIVGTFFGIGDNVTTFNLPDLRQRFPIGKAASGTGSTLGGTGGAIDHTHSVPAHYHGMGTGADLNITAGGSHNHQYNINTAGGYATPKALIGGADAGVTGSFTETNTHTHTSGTFAGRIGLVTGGVDGNAAMTSGTANAPFQAVNYIIKT